MQLNNNYWSMEPQAFEMFRMRLEHLVKAEAGRRDDPARKSQQALADLVAAVTTGDRQGGLAAQAAELGILRMAGPVAVVPIVGVMIKDFGLYAADYGVADTRLARVATAAARLDPEVASTLIRMDTPGGSTDGLPELADEIYAHRQTKNVQVQVDGMMASAGVYVGSQADAISAHRMDLIGSVGTAIRLYDFSKWFGERGIEAVAIDTSPYKSTGMFGTPLTEPQRADLQRIVDGFFADFKAMVRRGRNMTEAGLAQWTDARLHLAPAAQAMGMVDQIRTFEETLQSMQAAATAGTAADRLRSMTTRARAGLIARG